MAGATVPFMPVRRTLRIPPDHLEASAARQKPALLRPARLEIPVRLGQDLLNRIHSNGFILAAGLHFDGRAHRGTEGHHAEDVGRVAGALTTPEQDDGFALLHGADKSRGDGCRDAGMR